MDIKDLEEKYKAGETSLEEEQFLRENAANTDAELSVWFKYAILGKKEASADLKNRTWKAIENKTIRFRIGLFAAAASILFLALFFVQNIKKEEMSNQEKEAKLKEALAMLSEVEADPAKENILYEDELVIIYTSKK